MRNFLERALDKVIEADQKKIEEDIKRRKNAVRDSRLVKIINK